MSIDQPLYQAIASAIDARARCEANGNTLWLDRWEDRLNQLADCLPSGSGIDSGTAIDWQRSKANCLVLVAPYQHMNSDGYYDGWTEHTIRVRPSLIHGIELTISGRDRNQIKDYLGETFDHALRETAPEMISDERKAS